MMKPVIGPYSRDRIVLCSADAAPKAQRDTPCEAGYFFPGAAWVGALRNAAERLGCRFVILTSAYGMVDPDDVIAPYDLEIYGHEAEVASNWKRTIPSLIGNKCDVVVFHSGGCPKEECTQILEPVLRDNSISLITFGRPNMFDVGKAETIVKLLISGTSIDELRSILRCPDRLELFRASPRKTTGERVSVPDIFEQVAQCRRAVQLAAQLCRREHDRDSQTG
jgi:hypothetical protein